MATIRHLAIFAEDPAALAEFYVDVYGMRITGANQGDVWVTDGYMDLALISLKSERMKKGINHFGFLLEPVETAAVYEKMTARGLTPYDPRAADPTVVRPFVEDAGHDPEGNRFDLTTGKREMAEEEARNRARAMA